MYERDTYLGNYVSKRTISCTNGKNNWARGRGGGLVVSVLTFYSDNLCSNPAEADGFSVKFLFENKENKRKEAGIDPLKNWALVSDFPNCTQSGKIRIQDLKY